MRVENWKRLLSHPIAMEFPDADADTFRDLMHSIKATGYNSDHPIVLYEGKILDGRHRHRACKEVGVEPTFRSFTGTYEDAVAFSVSENLHRRHLTAGQRAMIGDGLAILARHRPPSEAQAIHGERNKSANLQTGVSNPLGDWVNPDSVEAASRRVHVAPRTVHTARKLREMDPEAARRVRDGQQSLNSAMREAKAKLEPKPKTSSPETDDAGRPIHPRARQAIAEGREVAKAIVRDIHAIKRRALAFAASDFGRGVHVQSIETDFANLVRAIRFAAPYTSCPLGDPCDSKCTLCHGTQWITQSSYDGMPDEFKTGAKA